MMSDRDNMSEKMSDAQDDAPETPQQQKLNAYISELLVEKALIDGSKCPHAYKLIDDEITKAQKSGRIPNKEQKFLDVYRERPVKVSVKVLVPVKEHPRYNFVGKLLGTKGSNLKQLQEETMCHISICGRGSVRDRQKEEEQRQSLQPKYAHLLDDLHMDIATLGSPAEAHARIAFALAEIRKYLIPDYEKPEGFMEIMPKPKSLLELPMSHRKPNPMMREMPMPHRKPPGGMMRGAGRRPQPPPPLMRPSRGSFSGMPRKMSILERARVQMDDSDEDEEYDENEIEYEDYRGGPAGHSRSMPYYGMSGQEYVYKKRKTYMD